MDHQEAMHIITDMSVYRTSVAIPYIDALVRRSALDFIIAPLSSLLGGVCYFIKVNFS